MKIVLELVHAELRLKSPFIKFGLESWILYIFTFLKSIQSTTRANSTS